MKFDIGANESSGELGIGGGTSTSTPNLRGDVVKLLAVLPANVCQPLLLPKSGATEPFNMCCSYLVCYYRAAGSSGICCNLCSSPGQLLDVTDSVRSAEI